MGAMPRLVSLVPCLTETVAALGVGPDHLVGRTDFCEEPADWIGGVPAVGGPKTPDLERIAALAPDVVLVDPEENRIEDARGLEASGVGLWVAAVGGPEDVPPLLRGLGDLLGLAGSAEPAAERLERRLAAPLPAPVGRAVTLVWWDPAMVVGPDRYGARLLRRAGWETPELGEGPYPAVPWERLRERAFDRLLLPSEPYVFSDEQAGWLAAQLGPAPDGSGRVQRIDGRDLFWYGARTAAALSRVSEAAGPGRGGQA